MEQNKKRLYRSNSDYIISGVCGGLAKYFEVDATLVRLIFVILSVGGGGGVIIYIIMALIIPKEPGERKEIDHHEKVREFAKDIKSKAKTLRERIGDEKDNHPKDRHNFFGILLVFIGLIILFNRILPVGWMRWDLFWPLIMIGVGLFIVLK